MSPWHNMPAVCIVLAACASNEPVSPIADPDRPPIEIRVLLDGAPRAGGGNLLVQTDYADEGTVEIGQPEAEGLTFTANGTADMEDLGERDVVSQRYVFQGRSGNYEIGPVTATWTPPEGEAVEVMSSPVFLDIEADPIQAGELVDIAEPSALWTLPWVLILSVGGVFVAGMAFAFWPRTQAPVEEEEPLPPDEAALERWAAVRWDESLTDEDKARQLSIIFREYTEGVLGFEATAWTSSEILRQLKGMALLPEGNVPRARRMLRATDRIKFAEERPPHELIEELDADLRAFVADTRPASWGAT